MKHFFRKKREAITISSNVILRRWNFEAARKKRNITVVSFKGLKAPINFMSGFVC